MYTEMTKMQLPSVEKPWLQFYSEKDIGIKNPTCSMYAYLKLTAKDRMNENALNYYGHHFTFKELFQNIDRTAQAFAALGVKKGETVSFLSVAIPETIFAIYALNKLGAVANMIDPRMDLAFIKRMVTASNSRYMFCVDVAFPKVEKLMGELGQKQYIVQPFSRSLPLVKKLAVNLKVRSKIPYDSKVIAWDQFIARAPAMRVKEVESDGSDVAAIAYTGGTTGSSKGVMFTNTSVNAVAFNFKYAGFNYGPKQSFLGMIPVFTSYGLVCGMHMPLCLGLELIPVPKFVPEKLGDLVKQFKPNHMISTPAFYEMFMNSKAVQNMNLSFLLTMGTGGDTMNEGLERRMLNWMSYHGIKYPLAQGYGLSEMSAAVTFCINDTYKTGSVGIPSLTTTVGIFDPDTGEELGYDEIGEVCVTGPSMMKGYYNQPEETAYVMREHADGQVWVHSGDLGYLDKEGFLFIKGRVKRMITRFDGHKVFPVSIESMVSANEQVHNCCVIGINDRVHSQGQYPMVLVELVEGVDKKLMCAEIYAQCKNKLEERGQPVAVLAVENLPLTGMGKNDYRSLEKEYADFDYTEWEP